MKPKTVRGSLLLLALLVTGCGFNPFGNEGPKDSMNNNDGQMPARRLKANIGLDMTQLTGFTLAPVGQAPASAPFLPMADGDCLMSNETNTVDGPCVRLYALSASDAVVPVEFLEPRDVTDSENNNNNGYDPNQSTVPQTIYNVGKFVFFVYPNGLHTTAGTCNMVVLMKNTGALYCSQDAAASCFDNNCWGMAADQVVQTSTPEGNIVHAIDGSGNLLRLDFSNPASAVSTTLLDHTEGYVMNYLANAGGDALAFLNTGGANIVDMQIYRHMGGFSKLNEFQTGLGGNVGLCAFRQPGTGENFFVVTPQDNNNTSHAIATEMLNTVFRVSLDAAGDATYETYAQDATHYLQFGACVQNDHASTADRHFIVGNSLQGSADSTVFLREVYNPTATLRRHTVLGLVSSTNVYGCEDTVVLRGRDDAGNEAIVRFYPDAETSETVIGSADYTITAVSVSDACDITFSGRRASDNSRILGNVKAGTLDVNILTNNLSGDIKQLVRIN